MTGDWFCVKCKSHHVADALNGKYDDKVLISFLNFSSKLQGLRWAENIGLYDCVDVCHVASPKFSRDSANNQCFSFSIIFLRSL